MKKIIKIFKKEKNLHRKKIRKKNNKVIIKKLKIII